MDVKEYFKLFLDDRVLAKAFEGRPDECPKIEEVQLWFQDYLREVYNHISSYFMSEFRCTSDEWSLVPVEYIFSVPTTWTEHSVIENYREVARLAGFGAGRSHSLEIGLPESEASAIWTAGDRGYEFQVPICRYGATVKQASRPCAKT